MDMPETTAVGPHQWGGLKIRRENLKKRQIIKKCVFIPDMKAVSVWECLRVQGVSYTVLESVFEQAIIRVCCIIDLQNDRKMASKENTRNITVGQTDVWFASANILLDMAFVFSEQKCMIIKMCYM